MPRVTRRYQPGQARPRDLPATFADVYAAVATDLRGELGDSLAQQAGPPQSQEVQLASDTERAKAWNEAAPDATDEAMWQLATQKYAEHRQAGLPDDKAQQATAEDLTHFRYRARQPLYTLGTTSWGEQVKEAERLSKLAAKQETPTNSQQLPQNAAEMSQMSPLSPSMSPLSPEGAPPEAPPPLQKPADFFPSPAEAPPPAPPGY